LRPELPGLPQTPRGFHIIKEANQKNYKGNSAKIQFYKLGKDADALESALIDVIIILKPEEVVFFVQSFE